MRENFGKPAWGSGLETARGGNHYRAWQQEGTRAWFLACAATTMTTEVLERRMA